MVVNFQHKNYIYIIHKTEINDCQLPYLALYKPISLSLFKTIKLSLFRTIKLSLFRTIRLSLKINWIIKFNKSTIKKFIKVFILINFKDNFINLNQLLIVKIIFIIKLMYLEF